MSEDKSVKPKMVGRGRGRGSKEGPWTRTNKVEGNIPPSLEPRRPMHDEKQEFKLEAAMFPPLPTVANPPCETSDSSVTTDLDVTISGISNSPSSSDTTDDINDINVKVPALEELHISTAEDPVESTKKLDTEFLVKTSTLSPYAPEFIPRNVEMNPAAEAFVPSEPQNNLVFNNDEVDVNSPIVLQDVEETLSFCHSKLMETPASFMQVMNVIEPHLIIYLKYPELNKKIISEVLKFTFSSERFTYLAVKMLTHLNARCNELVENNLFRDNILKTAQEYSKSFKEKLTNEEEYNGREMLALLLFLAELYIQLEAGDTRLVLIARSIIALLNNLLASTKVSIKERLTTIVSVLKLMGTYIDEDDSSLLNGLIADMEVVLVAEASNLDHTTIELVQGLIATRNRNWNTELINNDILEHQEPQLVDHMQNGYNYEPVFYGPDGLVMPAEEQVFLHVNTGGYENIAVFYDEQGSPVSMDGDMQDAYEQFLAELPGHMHVSTPIISNNGMIVSENVADIHVNHNYQ